MSFFEKLKNGLVKTKNAFLAKEKKERKSPDSFSDDAESKPYITLPLKIINLKSIITY